MEEQPGKWTWPDVRRVLLIVFAGFHIYLVVGHLMREPTKVIFFQGAPFTDYCYALQYAQLASRELGDPESSNFVALAYLNGRGVVQSDEMALRWQAVAMAQHAATPNRDTPILLEALVQYLTWEHGQVWVEGVLARHKGESSAQLPEVRTTSIPDVPIVSFYYARALRTEGCSKVAGVNFEADLPLPYR